MKKVFIVAIVIALGGFTIWLLKKDVTIPVKAIYTLSMPNHRNYYCEDLGITGNKDFHGDVVSPNYEVGPEDLRYFPYNFLEPSGKDQKEVLTRANSDLTERKKNNSAILAKIRSLFPSKADLLTRLMNIPGVYEVGFRPDGIYIHLDRKTGCWSQDDPESDGKSEVETPLLREIARFKRADNVRMTYEMGIPL